MRFRGALTFVVVVIVVTAVLVAVSISLVAVAQTNSQRHADLVALCHARNYTRAETQASFDQLFADVDGLVARGHNAARGHAEVARLKTAFDRSYQHCLPQLRCPR